MPLPARSSPHGEYGVTGSLPATATALVSVAEGVKTSPRQRCPIIPSCCWFLRYWCCWGRQQLVLLVLLASPGRLLGMGVAWTQACRFISQGWSFAATAFGRCEKIKQRKSCGNCFIHPHPPVYSWPAVLPRAYF